ncbi:MAG: DNA polymerase III subunit delta [Dehalococcoidia bacterium]
MAERLSGVLVLYGRDDYRIAQRVREASGGDDPALGDLNRVSIAGDKIAVNDLRGQLEAMPFLDDRRTVIVGGLLDRFEDAAKSQRRLAESDSFLDLFRTKPPTTFAILTGDDLRPKRNPLLSGLLAAGAAVERFALFRDYELLPWIDARARSLGLRLQPAAARRLATLAGPNLWVLSNELEKLATWADGQDVGEEAVFALTASSREESVFSLVDDLVAGRTTRALRELTGLLDSGESPFGVLALLQNRLRQVWLVHELTATGPPAATVKLRSGLGYLPDDAFRDLLALATRLTDTQLRAMHRALLETDEAIKTGRNEPRLALELLARTFSPAAATK